MRFEPLDLPRGAGDPVPTCRECHGLLRRAVNAAGEVIWVCDLHGEVYAMWIDPNEEEDDGRDSDA